MDGTATKTAHSMAEKTGSKAQRGSGVAPSEPWATGSVNGSDAKATSVLVGAAPEVTAWANVVAAVAAMAM